MPPFEGAGDSAEFCAWRVIEFAGGKIVLQRNYDCFEPLLAFGEERLGLGRGKMWLHFELSGSNPDLICVESRFAVVLLHPAAP
jgi:hypothetical protein